MTNFEKSILTLGLLIAIAMGTTAFLQFSEYKIKQETYVTSLSQSYDQNVEACREAVNKANEKASEEEKKKTVKTTCIDSINGKSREATLLKDWGYSNLLKTQ